MTTKELKEKAQDELIEGIRIAFSQIPSSDTGELREMMSDQFARVEKMFGHEPYSNVRGV